jgi:tetratricopeptide (TPR) repeat protein
MQMARLSIGFIALLLIPLSLISFYSDSEALTDEQILIELVKDLYAEENWTGIVQALSDYSTQSPETNYYLGMALSRLNRWREARKAFETGMRLAPQDKRFPLELAGVAYKEGNFRESKAHLSLALRLDPLDNYGNDFLATLYFLENNLEAALKYWNRIEKPRIEKVRIEPRPKINLVLLDRAIAFSPASVLYLNDYLTTKARLDQLGTFLQTPVELVPNPNQNFDLLLRPTERNGLETTRFGKLLGLFRGAPYETVYPEFYNLDGSALISKSLLRWDAQKRRIFTSISGPFKQNPELGYQVFLDARKETWDLNKDFYRADASGELKVQSVQTGGRVRIQFNGKWEWENEFRLSYRNFQDFYLAPTQSPALFTNAFALTYQTGIEYRLPVPERRLTLISRTNWEFGKFLRAPGSHFSQLQTDLDIAWIPPAKGDDFLTKVRLRAGKTFGQVPFDELFNLGVMQDNDLWIRGHNATRDHKKGNSPLGYDYLLFNSEVEKIILKKAFFQIKLVPFLDAGNIYDPSKVFGSGEWLWDVGIGAKLSILNRVTVGLYYGKNLRAGNNAIYPVFFENRVESEGSLNGFN